MVPTDNEIGKWKAGCGECSGHEFLYGRIDVRRLVLEHSPQSRPAGVQDFPIESRSLPDVTDRNSVA